ncbi:MAG TPA: aminotransferase class III-fold pyridoxal phosphate-dependent enzyme [Mesorhizobium sp.]|jgi:putrescine aminotransferase|uniref:aminotransferase family protein n=1 Tax=Mesorhizobium sp. TaxID=1871066 RepID=UPI002DDCB529|nr:aminotransferase class III-fold pyridoxal phosphate-dependent enzyme [Mesorhizobium sp.]HEV2502866.1 aminotransferase class III-fold pyridoxal phosphate-dependent enzyme [Mesorhizobium sp.]
MNIKTDTAIDWAARDARVVHHPHGDAADRERFVLVRGKGSTLWDADGREYIDAHAGAWLTQVGHGREELAKIAAEQMSTLAHFTIMGDYANIPTIEFCERLIARAPKNMAKVRLMSSGSEADDEALQLVRLYHHKRGQPQRTKVLVLRGSFHGRTYGGAELAGGRPGIGDVPNNAIMLTPPLSYHSELFGGEDVTNFCVRELEQTIARLGADNIAAMFGELVMGPAGMIPVPEDYWPRIVAVLKAHGILFVADEVVTAFGRAGAWYSSLDYNLTPDIIVLAKGIASGYVPLGALLLDGNVADVLDGAGGGGSYAGHLMASAIGSANIDIIERENLLEASRLRGKQFLDELGELINLPIVGDVRGRGLMIGVELVCDKATRQSLFDRFPQLKKEIPLFTRRKHGVITAIHGGAVALTPPLVITPQEVSRVTDAVGDALARVNIHTGQID